MKLTWESLTAPKGNIRVKVLRGDRALEWQFGYAFDQWFYLKKIGDKVDGISKRKVTITNLEVLPNRTNNEWDF